MLNEAPACVIDTQLVLDWVVFDDPRIRPWVEAIERGRLRWLVCAAMRTEALRVLHYPAVARRMAPSTSGPRLLDCFAQHATPAESPPSAPMHLRCSDPDDQVFLDLAVAHRAPWLLSRDRSLLRLRARAVRHSLTISTPELIDPPA